MSNGLRFVRPVLCRGDPCVRRIFCASLLVAIAIASGCDWVAERRLVSRIKNKPAPQFELTALDGKAVRLSDYRGKGVLLAFWAHE